MILSISFQINQCLLLIHFIRSPNSSFLHEKIKVLFTVAVVLADDDCPDFCTEHYLPVCAGPVDSRNIAEWETYGNDCSFRAANCHNKLSEYLPSLGDFFTHILDGIDGKYE